MGARNPFEFTIRDGMQRGMRSLSPLPTRLVSNERRSSAAWNGRSPGRRCSCPAGWG
jgi:hypothetical protein